MLALERIQKLFDGLGKVRCFRIRRLFPSIEFMDMLLLNLWIHSNFFGLASACSPRLRASAAFVMPAGIMLDSCATGLA
jgi:hypothetical protein